MTSVARIPQVQSPGRRPQPLSGRRYPVQGSDTRAMPPEADRGRHVDVAQAMPPAGGRPQPTAAKGRHCQSPEADVEDHADFVEFPLVVNAVVVPRHILGELACLPFCRPFFLGGVCTTPVVPQTTSLCLAVFQHILFARLHQPTAAVATCDSQ